MPMDGAGLRQGLGELARALRTIARHPGAWLLLLATWSLINAGIGLIPLAGLFLLSLVGPLFIGGVLQHMPAYLDGSRPRLDHLFGAFRASRLRSRLLAVGGWSIAFGFFMLALSLVLGMMLAMILGFEEGGPLWLGWSAFDWGMGVLIGLQFLLVTWFSLALFLGIPLVVFEGSEPIPALRGGVATGLRNLGFLIPVPVATAAAQFGSSWLCCLLLALTAPVLVVFQFLAYRTLAPVPDDPDPETGG